MLASKKILKLSVAAAIAAFGAQGVLAQEADEKARSTALEEVIVTALKRGDQTLVEIPASVTAFSGEQLSDAGTYSLQDFLQLAPGLSIATTAGLANVQIRGISSTLGTSTVGYYVDESPFSFVGANVTPDSRAFDMERVEVLRGPQGTLYGQGSIAGVIRLLTKNPNLNDPEFVADVSGSSTTDGGYNQQYNAAISMPLIEDKLAIRISGIYEDWDGWIDGLPGSGFDVLGRPVTFFSGEDLNTQEHQSARIKVLAKPSERSSLTALYWHSDTASGNVEQSREDRTNTYINAQPVDNIYTYAYINYSYEADHFTFLSNTSYIDAEYSSDLDFLGTKLVSLIENDGWTQEIRLNSVGEGPWQWTFGGLYQKLDQFIFQDLDELVGQIFGLADPKQTDDTTNWALFGDVTYYFNEQWDVSVGGRYFSDERITNDTSGVFPPDDIKQEFSDFSPRLNIAFHPNDRSTAFFQVAKGFRSGLNQFPLSFYTGQALGLILPAGAESEDLWSYELGYKSEFADGKVFLEAAVFLNDWTNLQQSVPVILGTLNAILNAGEAQSPGFELAAHFAPADGLSFGANVSWNDAAYSSDVGVNSLDPVTGMLVPVVLFPKDSRIARVPEWTANAWADYRWPLQFGDGAWEGYIHSDLQYRDEVLDSAGGSFQFADDSLTVRARIGADNGRWGIFLFADNLFDEDGAYTPGFPPQQPTRLRPRTVGLNLKFRM